MAAAASRERDVPRLRLPLLGSIGLGGAAEVDVGDSVPVTYLLFFDLLRVCRAEAGNRKIESGRVSAQGRSLRLRVGRYVLCVRGVFQWVVAGAGREICVGFLSDR